MGARRLERVEGIEPSYSAWKAAALPLSYTRPRGTYALCKARWQPGESDLSHLRALRAASARAQPPRAIGTGVAALLNDDDRKGGWWGKQDSNLRRLSQRIYSPPPLPLGTFPRRLLST